MTEKNPTTITVDAATFARAWRSCALAYSKDTDRPVLDRTIAVELYPNGCRLIATDGTMLLHSWVGMAEADNLLKPPAMRTKPKSTTVVHDPHGRGVSLAAHLINLTSGENAPILDIVLTVGIDDEDEPGTLGGMDRIVCTLEVPDQERLKLPVIEQPYPNWRNLIASFELKQVDGLFFNPELLERLGKLRKFHPDRPLSMRFGGSEGMAMVSIPRTQPPVAGAVMPVRVQDA